MTRIGEPPEHTPLGERLAARTAPVAPDDESYGYAQGHFTEALSQPAIQLQEAFDPVDAAAFETVLDPARCPEWALPWLAQLAGLTLPATADTATQRQIIVALAPQKRGTTAMLEAAAGLYLTGSKTIYFRERDPTAADPPYTLEVVTRTDETPDPQAVLAALMAQKPGAIVLNYRNVVGWDYQQMTAEGGTYAQQTARFATYFDLSNNDPI